MRLFTKLSILFLLFLFSIGGSLRATGLSGEAKEKNDAADYQGKSEDTRIAVKLNGLVFIGIINPAVEFRVMPKWTVQLEGLGSFYHKNFLGSHKPFVLGATWGEFRFYPKHSFDGFFLAPNIGWGVYQLNKGSVPGYGGSYPESYFQMGSNLMAGLTIGYQLNLGRHWSIEASWGAGWQGSTYQGYDKENDTMYVDVNGSGEWLPLYKCGIFATYRF